MRILEAANAKMRRAVLRAQRVLLEARTTKTANTHSEQEKQWDAIERLLAVSSLDA